MLKKQLFYPRNLLSQEIPAIKDLGVDEPDGFQWRRGADWGRGQVFRDRSFLLQAGELHYRNPFLSQIKQGSYIKFNFWLEGRHATVLDGFGQWEDERPQVLITAGPRDMIKMDWMGAGHSKWVALCVLPDFFEQHMAMDPEALPEKLRAVILPKEPPFAAHAISLTPALSAAARAVLATPSSVRRTSLYAQSKAIELMCLLIGQMDDARCAQLVQPLRNSRQIERLHAARQLLARRCTESVSLHEIARELGISKTALTVGFRNLFGESVFEFVQKERMQRAYDLLQSGEVTIKQVAQAVGYPHACNFSTAFRAHFGYSPKAVRIH